jgi:hypothetical protein
MDSLMTIGQLALHFRVPVHRVRYVVERQGREIPPASRVGRTRVWDAGGRDEVGRALKGIGRGERVGS